MTAKTSKPDIKLVTSEASAKSSSPSPVQALVTSLSNLFPERGETIRALLVAAVAGEHAVVLGPPGTAKSLLARTLSGAFGSSYFEWLLTKFTTPEELFGPIKLSALQQDKFTRATAGLLPTCEVVFLDEVFKANSAILNALLTVLNERKFHDDGQAVNIPLVTCIAASNELPEGPELDALYDRFLVRLTVDYVADRDAFRSLLTSGPISLPGKCVDIHQEQAAARAVRVTDDTVEALINLRYACRAAGIQVSDRRWRQCLSLVRAQAHLDGRTETDPDDLEVLEHVLWKKPDERVAVARVVQTTINPAGAKAVEELDAAREIFAKIPELAKTDRAKYMGVVAGAVQDVGQILKRLEALPAGRKVNQAKTEVSRIKQDVAKLALRASGIEV